MRADVWPPAPPRVRILGTSGVSNSSQLRNSVQEVLTGVRFPDKAAELAELLATGY